MFVPWSRRTSASRSLPMIYSGVNRTLPIQAPFSRVFSHYTRTDLWGAGQGREIPDEACPYAAQALGQNTRGLMGIFGRFFGLFSLDKTHRAAISAVRPKTCWGEGFVSGLPGSLTRARGRHYNDPATKWVERLLVSGCSPGRRLMKTSIIAGIGALCQEV